jgi:hypothetical protein
MDANALADQPDEGITGLDRRGRRTGMSATAAAIHLPGRNPGQTNTRPFGTPDRAVAIPHPGGRAGEGLAHGLSRGRGKEEQGKYHGDLGAEAGARWV